VKQIESLEFHHLQLDIIANTPAEFLAKAKEIVLKHKELQAQATAMQSTVTQLEDEQQKLVSSVDI